MNSNFNDLIPTGASNNENQLELKKKTDELIKKGLECPTASTGTPIKDLNGGARFMAQISNIGGGSVETGGGDIKDGFNTIAANIAATVELNNLPDSDKEPTTYIECDAEDETTNSD